MILKQFHLINFQQPSKLLIKIEDQTKANKSLLKKGNLEEAEEVEEQEGKEEEEAEWLERRKN